MSGSEGCQGNTGSPRLPSRAVSSAIHRTRVQRKRRPSPSGRPFPRRPGGRGSRKSGGPQLFSWHPFGSTSQLAPPFGGPQGPSGPTRRHFGAAQNERSRKPAASVKDLLGVPEHGSRAGLSLPVGHHFGGPQDERSKKPGQPSTSQSGHSLATRRGYPQDEGARSPAVFNFSGHHFGGPLNEGGKKPGQPSTFQSGHHFGAAQDEGPRKPGGPRLSAALDVPVGPLFGAPQDEGDRETWQPSAP